jgi:hypothetical protein
MKPWFSFSRLPGSNDGISMVGRQPPVWTPAIWRQLQETPVLIGQPGERKELRHPVMSVRFAEPDMDKLRLVNRRAQKLFVVRNRFNAAEVAT